ncbi:MAG: MurR/RpiR family transcriptional regulator [Hespellia sp.]|nr:MurR/RpiR family transcriptional regulator [Hespellia sp.]
MAMEKLISKLVNISNNTDHGEMNHIISVGLIKNLYCIPKHSINEMADVLGVSPSSLSRFVKKMNFNSYGFFREQICFELKNTIINFPSNSYRTKQEFNSAIANSIIDKNIYALEILREEIKGDMIQEIINALYKAEHIYGMILNDSPLNIFHEFQYHMAFAKRVINISNGWIKSTKVPNHSLRIIPRVYCFDGNQEKLTDISVIKRRPEDNKYITDIHIYVWDILPIGSKAGKNTRNDSCVGIRMLEYILEIIYTSYQLMFMKDDGSFD